MSFHSAETQPNADGYGPPHVASNASPYTYRVWQDEYRPHMDASYDAQPRVQRTPQNYSFLRQFDVAMGSRRLLGPHMSMADHRRIEQPVYGMQTTKSTRNTYRLAPSPLDVFTVAYPETGQSQNPGQNFGTSPISNYMQQAYQSRWGLR